MYIRISINQNQDMKNTKKMLAGIAAYLLTWLLFTLICYAISDYNVKQSSTNGVVLVLQFVFGWIPSLLVIQDMNQKK